ncbi:MAG: pilus assembly protein TadG-related protein [Gaiellaceae bacterium]
MHGISRLRRRVSFRRSDGQALVLVALMLPLLIGIAALVVNQARLLVMHRALQNAADAAALAAAQDVSTTFSAGCDATCLGSVRTSASSTAAAYSARNGGPSGLGACQAASDTNCYTWPYKSDSERIEVRLTQSVPTMFAKIAAFKDIVDVSARAVAATHPVTTTKTTTIPGQGLALFAYTHNGTDPCASPFGIVVNGNPQTSIDGVLSNGSVTANSSGTVTYAGFGPPTANCAKAGTRQSGVGTWEQLKALRDWPMTFDRAAVCAGHDSATARTLNNPAQGIYCSSVGIIVNGLGGGRSYNITLVAPVVTIPTTANNFTLNPDNADLDAANKNLSLWQYGAGQNFTFNHNNAAVNGVMWIQNGNLDYTGNSGATGFYEAQNIAVTGNSYVMRGNGPVVGEKTVTETNVVGATYGLGE